MSWVTLTRDIHEKNPQLTKCKETIACCTDNFISLVEFKSKTATPSLDTVPTRHTHKATSCGRKRKKDSNLLRRDDQKKSTI